MQAPHARIMGLRGRVGISSRGISKSFSFYTSISRTDDLSHQIDFWLDYRDLDEFYVTQIYQKVEIVVQ